jgi:hypothetical protein
MCDDEINCVPQEHLEWFIVNSHGIHIYLTTVKHVFTGLGSDSYTHPVQNTSDK